MQEEIKAVIQNLNSFFAKLDDAESASLRLDKIGGKEGGRAEKIKLLMRQHIILSDILDAIDKLKEYLVSMRSSVADELKLLGVDGEDSDSKAGKEKIQTIEDMSLSQKDILKLAHLHERLVTRLEFLKLNLEGRLDSSDMAREKRKILMERMREKLRSFFDACDAHSMGKHKIKGRHEDGEVRRAGREFEHALQLYCDSCVTAKEKRDGERAIRILVEAETKEHRAWQRAERSYDNYIAFKGNPITESEKELLAGVREAIESLGSAPAEIADSEIKAIVDNSEKLAELASLVCDIIGKDL